MSTESSKRKRVGPAKPSLAPEHDWPYLCSVLVRALEPFPEAKIAAAAAIEAGIEYPPCPTCGQKRPRS